VIAADARIDPAAHIGALAVIGAGAVIESGAVVHPHVVVGAGCVIGKGTTLHPHVVLYPGVRLAGQVVVHAGSVLGADGFGYASDGPRHHKIPQVGGVEIGAEVEIGALSAIDRAVLDDTTVGAGTKIDNLVQVGHNVRIGRDVMISGMTGLAGSAQVGDGAVLGGQVGVAGHLTIGERTQVAGQSLVMDSTEPGSVIAGTPTMAIGSWRRQQVLLRRLGEIWRRLRALELRSAVEAEPMDDTKAGEDAD
jgi:UDP-3-O-[3-hydroxymyristoyl] glucosamine N-acyltransferase